MVNQLANLVLILAFTAGSPIASCCRLASMAIPGKVGVAGEPAPDKCRECCRTGDPGPAHAPRHAPTCDCGPAKALPPIVGTGAVLATALPTESGFGLVVCAAARSAAAVEGVHAPPAESLVRLHCALII